MDDFPVANNRNLNTSEYEWYYVYIVGFTESLTFKSGMLFTHVKIRV